MSVLVYIDTVDKEIKKSSFEAISYAAQLAKLLGTDAVGVLLGEVSGDIAGQAGNYGLSKVLHANDNKLNIQSSAPYATVVAAAAEKAGADVVILPKSSLADAMASKIAIKLKAGVVTNVIQLPELSGGF